MERKQIYYCAICGNVVEVLDPQGGTLVCCGEPMRLMIAGVKDAIQEKHVPQVLSSGNGVIVRIGEIEHPMTAEHHIVFIELITANMIYRVDLDPSMKPEANFPVKHEEIIEVREYCNLHGLWKK